MDNFVLTFCLDFWATITQMAPYLLFGFFVAGILSVLIPPEMVERHLGGRGLLPVIKASLFGVPLPLCSCGVIPVAASLRQHGASKGATVSFLLSTPETGIDSIFVTWSLLGPIVGIYRPIVAFITGLIGGAAVDMLHGDDAKSDFKHEACVKPCCMAQSRKRRIITALTYGFVSLPRDIGGAMIVGLLIAAGIAAFVPKDFLGPMLGGGIVAMLIMMAVGIPVYVCASASVPIAAALIAKGVSPGAAWVFLMTGPATNAATIAMVWNMLGKRTAVIYLLTIAVCALSSGLLLDVLIKDIGIPAIGHHHQMSPTFTDHVLAGMLVGILLYGMVSKLRAKRIEAAIKHRSHDHNDSCCDHK
ncbi:MAG: SO_0444 family Cu/Zn efflux transporter [Sedimentisphaerales bacterium]|nr:SO_0444 family Cu/Zn efflux transporter [Sedimentisphaerales bacterium]